MDFVYCALILLFAALTVGFAVVCDRVEKRAMNVLYLVGGVAALGLFVYLLYALLRAEEF